MGIERICCALLLAACGLASAQSIQDYATALDAKGGYDIAVRPKIKPDTAMYVLSGDIEIVNDPDVVIARNKRPRGVTPWATQLLREMDTLAGTTEEPYFGVKLPKHLLKPFEDNARMNGNITVVGRYTNNIEIDMQDGSTRRYPLLTAVAIEIEGATHADSATAQQAKESAEKRARKAKADAAEAARKAEGAEAAAETRNKAEAEVRRKQTENYEASPTGVFSGLLGKSLDEPSLPLNLRIDRLSDGQLSIDLRGANDGCDQPLKLSGQAKLSGGVARFSDGESGSLCRVDLSFTTGHIAVTTHCRRPLTAQADGKRAQPNCTTRGWVTRQ